VVRGAAPDGALQRISGLRSKGAGTPGPLYSPRSITRTFVSR
jgi:hypothetical protein